MNLFYTSKGSIILLGKRNTLMKLYTDKLSIFRKCQSTATFVGPLKRTIGTVNFKLNDNTKHFNVDNLMSQDIIENLSLKSLLKKNPEVRRFMSKVDCDPATDHPFVRVAGNLFFQQDDFISSVNTPGFWVYLMSRLFHTNFTHNFNGIDSSIAQKTLCLSKSINQLAAAFRIHRTIQEDTHPLWNKLAILTGDLLVVESIGNVTKLRDSKLLLWTMHSLTDFSTFEFQRSRVMVNYTPEASLLSTAFRALAKFYFLQDREFLHCLNRLSTLIGSLLTLRTNQIDGYDCKDVLNILETDLMAEQVLQILDSQFQECTQVSKFFKNFVLFSSHPI